MELPNLTHLGSGSSISLAGNTVVIQPSSSAPLSLIELAKILQDVLPKRCSQRHYW